MKTVTSFPRPVREIENAWITLADGCRLAARIWLPQDAEAKPVPAILEYLPYRKRDGTVVRDHLTHPYFAGHGYAAVRVDMRGNGESDGLMWDEYLKQEQDDALEVIAWLAAQPWCSGAVGMIGISWGGFNGLQIAARRPPALKAVITLCSTVDRYADDIHYKGGALLLENLGWSSTMLAYSSRPPDPALVGERWRDLWLERLSHEPLLLEPWLVHQHRDEYWKHGSICEDYGAIEAAVLAVGGWGDAYRNAVGHLMANLKAPVRGIMGPWVHKYPHFAVPGPAIGFLQEALRWWDHWLKGMDTGVMAEPMLRAYVMDSVPPRTEYPHRDGRWVGESAWPSPAIAPLRLAVNEGKLGAAAEPGDPMLLASPQTVGVSAGEYCPIWLGPESPGDQRLDDAGSLLFDSAPLGAPCEILGATEVTLELSVDVKQANLAVRLCDVHPGGASTRITYGILNLCHRDSHEHPAPLEPGKRYRVRVVLDDVGYRVPAGHRLRLVVSTAYWPLIWPSPEPVMLTVYPGAGKVAIPVRQPRAETAPVFPAPVFPEPEAAPPAPLRAHRHPAHQRTVDRDMATGQTVMRIVDDFGESENTDHGLVTGGVARETFRILPDDPTSASCETHWTMTMRRGAWSVRTETTSALTCDAQNFTVTGTLDAFENEARVLRRDWKSVIPRRHV